MYPNLGVSLSDYQSGARDNQVLFDTAETSQEQLTELSKALDAGSITGRETTNRTDVGAQGLKVESLEKNLKLITFKESDIRFWRRIPKKAAFNTVEEYNQLTSYGTDRGGFNNEGELPVEEDSTYVRRAELVKFLGTTKSVTHPMQLVNVMINDIIQREITNGIQWILRKANKGLFFADSKKVPQEFNGIYAQHQSYDAYANYEAYFNSEVVIDLRGKRLNEDVIEQGSDAIIRNYGYANTLIAPTTVLSNFVKNYHESKFIQPVSAQVSNGIAGQRFQKFQSQFGEIDLDYDVFALTAPARMTTDPAQSTNAPAGIIPDATTPIAVNVDGRSRWADSIGDYFYAVAASNRYGESQLVPLKATLTTAVLGSSFDLKFADGGGTNPATCYVIYRSQKNPTGTIAQTSLYPIITVGVTEKAAGYDGAAPTLIRDTNKILPGMNQALLYQDDEEVYAFKQLAPIMKMDLAILGPATRFMILMYGTPVLYAPKKVVRFVNVGILP